MGIEVISLQLPGKKDRRGENYRKGNTSERGEREIVFCTTSAQCKELNEGKREIAKLGDISYSAKH